MQARTALVIAPHALDEVLGCAGTMARLADAGTRIETLILFGDGTGRDADRRVCAETARDIVGSGGLQFGGFEENNGDRIRLGDIVTTIEASIRDLEPDLVFVPSAACLHVDHRVTHEAAITALRPVPDFPVRRILAFEIVSSSDWLPPVHWPNFSPACIVDISATASRKRQALEAYQMEMRSVPHARSIEAVMRRAETLGASYGLLAAEGFETLREVV